MTTATATAYTIDAAHSSVEFAVKHMVFSTAKGRFNDFAGTINLDEGDLANSSVNVTIQAASIDTRDEGRNGHLKSADFFDVENYPTITFTSTAVKVTGDGEFNVTGDLTIRGVTKSVVLKAERTGEGVNPWGVKVVGFAAETKINRKDFDLNWNAALEAGGVLVADDVKISIEVEANPAQAEA
ncbi:MAG: YceI family protein [Thermomicrobiales bacterium]